MTAGNYFYDYDEIFKFIVEHKRNNDGNSPSVREITDECGLSSTSVAYYILTRLEEEGRIQLKRNGLSRSIHVVGGEWSFQNATA